MEIMSNLHKFEFYAYGGRAKAGNILIYLEMVVKINELSQSTIWMMIFFFSHFSMQIHFIDLKSIQKIYIVRINKLVLVFLFFYMCVV